MIEPSIESSRLGVAGKLTRIFLKNGKISALTILILSAWGGLSFFLMPKQYNPEIVAPAFTITTTLPNASTEETYELLTRRIEDAVSELPQRDQMLSQSFAGGRSIVTISFIVGSSREDTTIALRQKLSDTATTLPREASLPIIQSIDPDDVPILDIGFSSQSLSETALRQLAVAVNDQLKLVDGVSKTEVKGGHENNLHVDLSGATLSAHHMTISDVIRTIEQSNGSFGVGSIESNTSEPMISISGDIEDRDTLANIILREEDGTFLRLRDVATVSYGIGDISHFVRFGTEELPSESVVHVALSKTKGTNTATVSSAALARLETLKQTIIPESVQTTILRDEGRTSSEEISKLSFDLTKSIVIVGVLLMIFLGFRNALVASISIPLVLLTVFGIGLLVDQTINRITLFALILSLGLLVDDAIVVVENIARYFRLFPNEPKMKLIIRAVDEVGGALMLSTFTMAIVFLPMAFVTGMMGPYMGPIPFFVPTALFASLLISVTLNPFLASIFTRPIQEASPNQNRNLFSWALSSIESHYTRALSSLLKHSKQRRFALGITAILLLASIALPFTPIVPFRMLPKADKEQFYLTLDLPEEKSIIETDHTTRALEEILLRDVDIESVESFVGTSQIIDFNGLFKGNAGRVAKNQATLKANLTHHDTRKETSESIAFRVGRELDSFRQEFPDATVRIVEDPPGPPVLSTFLLKIKGENKNEREQIARDIASMASNISGVVDLDTTLPERSSEESYRIQSDKANQLGIPISAITDTLQTALSGAIVGIYHNPVNQENRNDEAHIIVRFDKESRDSIQDLHTIKLPSRSGQLISLSEIIQQTDQQNDRAILADNRIPTTFVSAEMGDRSIVYAVLDIFPKLLHYQLPDGNGQLVSWSPLSMIYENPHTLDRFSIEIDGEWKLTLEVFRDLGIAMAIGIFLIFFILAARTSSFLIPMLIMVSIPLGLIGILPGFAFLHAIKGTYFNATSMIGVIALSGLSVKNAVIYLEYLEPLKRAGKPLRDALVETGRIRLLPITLTSLAAIFGSLTIISDPVWEGLAWSIIFGLSASTILTLIVFPLLYFIFERKHWNTKDHSANSSSTI